MTADFDSGRRDLLKRSGAVAVGAMPGGTLTTTEISAAAAHLPVGETHLADELCFTSASVLIERLRRRELSAREMMLAHLARIARLNPRLNAIVAQLPDDQCLALADDTDRRRVRVALYQDLDGLPLDPRVRADVPELSASKPGSRICQ